MSGEAEDIIRMLNAGEITLDRLTDKGKKGLWDHLVRTGRTASLTLETRQILHPTTRVDTAAPVAEAKAPSFLERIRNWGRSPSAETTAGTGQLPTTALPYIGAPGPGGGYNPLMAATQAAGTYSPPIGKAIQRSSQMVGQGAVHGALPFVPAPKAETPEEQWAAKGGEVLGQLGAWELAGATVGRLAVGGAARLLPKATPLIARTAALGAAGQAATVGTVTGYEAAAHGKPIGEVAKETGYGVLGGAAFGGAIGAIGGGLASLAQRRAAKKLQEAAAKLQAQRALPAGQPVAGALRGAPQARAALPLEPEMRYEAGAAGVGKVGPGARAGRAMDPAEYTVFDAVRARARSAYKSKAAMWKAVQKEVEPKIGREAFAAAKARLDPILITSPSQRIEGANRYWVDANKWQPPEELPSLFQPAARREAGRKTRELRAAAEKMARTGLPGRAEPAGYVGAGQPVGGLLPPPAEMRFEAGPGGTAVVGPGSPIYAGPNPPVYTGPQIPARREARLLQALAKRAQTAYANRQAFWQSVLKETKITKDDPLVAKLDGLLRERKSKLGKVYSVAQPKAAKTAPKVLAPTPPEPVPAPAPALLPPAAEPVSAPQVGAPEVAATVAEPVIPVKAARTKAGKAAPPAPKPVVPKRTVPAEDAEQFAAFQREGELITVGGRSKTPEEIAELKALRAKAPKVKVGDRVRHILSGQEGTVVEVRERLSDVRVEWPRGPWGNQASGVTAVSSLAVKPVAPATVAPVPGPTVQPTAPAPTAPPEAPVIQPAQGKAAGAVAVAEKTATPDELTAKFKQESAPVVAAETQRGSIRFGKAEAYKPASPEVEAAYKAGQKPVSPVREATRKFLLWAKAAKEEIWDFEPLLKKFPRVQEAVRRIMAAPFRAQAIATQRLEAICGELFTKKQTDLFARLVIEENWLYSLERGEKVPFDLTADQLKLELAHLRSQADESILKAVDRHWKMMRAYGEELVRRGKLPAEALRDKYFPHRVMDYARDVEERLPWLPRHLKEPVRAYTKKRMGSVRPVGTQYFKETYRHITKVELDNMLDDFIEKVAREGDATEKFAQMQTQRAKLLEAQGKKAKRIVLTPGMRVTMGGQEYRGWTPKRGRAIYSPGNPVEETVLRLAEEAAPREGQQVMLIPEEIAKRLDEFRTPPQILAIEKPLRAFHRFWRPVTINASGLMYHVNNLLFGDVLNQMVDNPHSFLQLGDALKTLIKGGKYAALAEEAAVLESGFTAVGSSTPFGSARIRKLAGLKGGWDYWNPLQVIRRLSGYREALPKMMLLIDGAKRIERGQKITSRMVGIEGLTPMEAVGKIARAVTVDYGALSPTQRRLKDLAFPFATWYVGNLKNWAYYASKHPADFAARVLIPYVAMQAYNNLRFPEIESDMPEWYRLMPHIITGYYSDDGKPIVLAVQTPADMAARWFGGTDLLDEAWMVVRGEKTPGQAAKDAVVRMAKAPGREIWNMLTPVIKSCYEGVTGKDSYTGAPLVPSELIGTPEGTSRLWQHILGNLFTPYGNIAQFAAAPEPGSATLRWALKRPFSLKRAVGIREVNVEGERKSRFYEAKRRAEGKSKSAMAKIEKAYVQGKVTGDMNAYKLLRGQYKDIVTVKQVQARMKSLDVQIQVVKEQLRHVTDPGKRAALKLKLAHLKDEQIKSAYETTPTKQKPEVRPFYEDVFGGD